MVDAEVQDRRDRKTAMYLKISKLRDTALLEDVICGTVGNGGKVILGEVADVYKRQVSVLSRRLPRLPLLSGEPNGLSCCYYRA